MGRVTCVDMYVDLENSHGRVLKNVNSKKLLKIRSISEGDYVIKGSWLGQVQRVVDKVTVLFDDGSNYEVIALETGKLLSLNRNSLEDSQYPYYLGQRVKVKSSTGSRSARWLCGNWRDNRDEGTVCAVEAGLVCVNWFASVLMGSNSNADVPPHWQYSKNLTLMSCFSHANWQLGDSCTLPVAADQKEQIFEDADFTEEHHIARGCTRGNLSSDIGEIFVIGKIKSKVDIVWQDGEHSSGLDPRTLLPVNVIDNHEFWPQQFVLEKGASDDPLKPSSQTWGVVQCVDAKERTVEVQWRNVSISKPENVAGDKMEETVSAYELIEHPDYSYCFGDIVFKTAQKQFGYQADKDQENPVTDLNVEADLRDRNHISYQNEFPDNGYLSCIGNVTGFRDGAVEVKWASGLTTKVAPYEILRIDKYESSTATPIPYEVDVEELTQDMIEHANLPSDGKGKGLNGENCEKHSGECSSFSLPRATIELLSSIKASLFHIFGVTTQSEAVSLVHTYEEENESGYIDEKEEVSETCDPCTESDPTSELPSTENKTPDEEVVRIHKNEDFPVSLVSSNSDQFKQFDILYNCSDHHFFGEGEGLALSQVKRGWVKKVQQEWTILEKNLPETIYVRAFEERMDLLRAAIVGAPGTPYHDGLFFFDIRFPPEYPHQPPTVHYNSGGLRLNPNLYESGKVCLSLLNTWTGTSTEMWNPKESTILQVLLSLQALVLNEKPYFNEAGYDQQIGRAEGEKNSVSYNENAFLVTCKSILYVLRKPPQHFEALVGEHFSRRAQDILLASKAYLDGAPVGHAVDYEETGHENQKKTSTGNNFAAAKIVNNHHTSRLGLIARRRSKRGKRGGGKRGLVAEWPMLWLSEELKMALCLQ
ncbi:hypothetical protein L6164_036672 [Bauhinia variegata]|uniref:Uncharacterized protein n=1 Tax=Bauhinia variegata TaxID=167791 RepID=A0ACB9KHS3_BAUVA|nr:hypothetical protein L6164_036672 [Bauhinia variegata]